LKTKISRASHQGERQKRLSHGDPASCAIMAALGREATTKLIPCDAQARPDGSNKNASAWNERVLQTLMAIFCTALTKT
jgi:hypothetical protein